MTEPKKISFGFSKLSKKTNLFIKPVVEEKKVELIDCLEEKSIKIKDAVKEEFKPLVIPMQGDTNTLADRIRNTVKSRTATDNKKETIETDERPDSELTLDELAARQLIQEAKKFDKTPNAVKVHTLPIAADKLTLEGSKESTLDDYDNVPIGDYGLAMLRGMGWSEDSGIGKIKKVSLIAAPELRPKGMGLGANKMVNSETTKKPAVDRDGKELTLIKGAYVKIIAGKEKGNYCLVQGLDDEAGRVIVKTALGGAVLSLNEFLLVPVTPEEYSKSSKILNNVKYEEFIKKEKKDDNIKHGRIKEEKPSRIARSKSPPDITPLRRTEKNEDRNDKKKYESYHSDSEDYDKKKDSGSSKSKDKNQDKIITNISSDSEDYDSKYKNKSKGFEGKRIANKKDKRSKRDKSRSRSRSRNAKKDKYNRSSSNSSDSNSEYESKNDRKEKSRSDKKSKYKKKSKKNKKNRSRKNSESGDSVDKYRKQKKSSLRYRKDSSSDSEDNRYQKDRRSRK